MLDMPHGGIIYSNSPVECFLNYQDASPPRRLISPWAAFLLDTTQKPCPGPRHIIR